MPKKKELEQHAEDLKESMIKATRECQEQQMCEIRGDQPVSEKNAEVCKVVWASLPIKNRTSGSARRRLLIEAR